MMQTSPALRLGRLARLGRAARATLLALLVTICAACQTAPITGRSQFIIISPEEEIQLGVEAYAQALEQAPKSSDPTQVRRVERVGMRLVEAAGRTDLEWQFAVIADDSTLNAWALPGGKVAVYTGLLNLTAGDDALLATVLGHEIAHVTIRHGAERISAQLGLNVVAAGVQAALYEREPETVSLVMSAFGLGAEFGFVRPFGRDQEAEADRVGLRYMARAGYHPAKAIEFWKRMSENAGSGGLEFLSTHPSHDTRVANLHEWQAEALEEYRPAPDAPSL